MNENIMKQNKNKNINLVFKRSDGIYFAESTPGYVT